MKRAGGEPTRVTSLILPSGGVLVERAGPSVRGSSVPVQRWAPREESSSDEDYDEHDDGDGDDDDDSSSPEPLVTKRRRSGF